MDDELRVLYEGYRPGLYVRIELHNMPCEFVEHFNPFLPMVLGGMTSSESVIGCLQVSVSPIFDSKWFLYTILSAPNCACLSLSGQI